MEYLMNYIKPELLLIIPVLYIIGKAIKQSQAINDKYIPLLLGLCGILLSTFYVLSVTSLMSWQDTFAALFTAITQGILCAGMSVYVNQLVKQAGK